MINRILDNIYGSILVSVIIGFGLSSLFRFTCKHKNCIQYIAPKRRHLNNKVVSWEKNAINQLLVIYHVTIINNIYKNPRNK